MFSVFLELQPRPEVASGIDCLEQIKLLKPAYERMPGFVGDQLFRSVRRPAGILSLSYWHNEKALVRWRVDESHHKLQLSAREGTLSDYRLRIGQVTLDTGPAQTLRIVNQRFDESEAGRGVTITLIEGENDPAWVDVLTAREVAEWLGFDGAEEEDCAGWDVYQGVDRPGEFLLLVAWRSHHAADGFSAIGLRPECTRFRRIRVIRDYGMFDRREAPQFYRDVAGRPTLHA